MKFFRWVKSILAILMVICLAAGILLTAKGYQLYHNALESKSLAEQVLQLRAQPNYTTFADLPVMYRDAVVAVEDHRFYSHGGIDFIAITRALWNDIRAGALVEGGSTITQQLAKNLYFTQEKQFTRKIAEVFMAFAFERICTKEEIFELYVNSIYFGNGYYGISAASRGYFGKEPSALTDYECTLLAGIPNAPSAYAPTQSPELAAERQRQVLDRMVTEAYLTQSQAEAIFAQGKI